MTEPTKTKFNLEEEMKKLTAEEVREFKKMMAAEDDYVYHEVYGKTSRRMLMQAIQIGHLPESTLEQIKPINISAKPKSALENKEKERMRNFCADPFCVVRNFDERKNSGKIKEICTRE